MPAHTVSEGESIATYSGKRSRAVFRRVTRRVDRNDEVGLILAGSVVPQWMPRAMPVVVRVRRTR